MALNQFVMIKLLSLIAALSFSASLFASHAAGGYIRAEYEGPAANGNLQYRLSVSLWRERTGLQLGTQQVLQIDAAGIAAYDETLPIVSSQYYNGNLDLEYYETVITLNPNTTYTFSWHTCCRAPGITSIVGNSSAYGIYIYSELNTGTGRSHPEILARIVMHWANSDQYQNSVKAFNIDGDSVLYEFVPVLEYNMSAGPIAIPSSPPNPAAARPGMSNISSDGMIIMNGRNPAGITTEVYASAIDFTSIERASGLEVSLMHVDFMIINSGNVADFVKPLMSFDPKMTSVDAYSFRYNQQDTLRLSLDSIPRAGEWFYPSWVDSMIVYQGPTNNPQGVYLRMDFDSVYSNFRVPAVLRFYFGQDYAYDFHFTLSGTSGVGLAESEVRSLRCYPNPTNGEFRVELPQVAGELNVMDLNGRRVAEYNFSGDESELVVQAPESRGIYILVMIDEQGTVYSEQLSVF